MTRTVSFRAVIMCTLTIAFTFDIASFIIHVYDFFYWGGCQCLWYFSQVDFDEFVEMMHKICDVKVRN